MKKKKNVYEIIKTDERFRILSNILENTGIGSAMSKEQEAFTFFAPTDDAFRSLSEKAMNILINPEGKELAAAVLGQHLIPDCYLYSNDLRSRDSVQTLRGNKLKIKEDGNMLQLGKAHILMPGIAATNGVVFPLSKVLPIRRKFVAGV